MADNKPELPEAFLKRWLKASNEELTDTQIADEFEAFADNLRWSLIKNKLVKQFDLKVEEAEIRAKVQKQIEGYLMQSGMMDPSFINSMVDRMMQDQKQVETAYEECMVDKLHDALEAEITGKDEAVSKEEFEKIVKAAQEAAQAARSPKGE